MKLAARILVMKDGEAVQTGTHEELIVRDGEYKRLYEAQEQWYSDGDVSVSDSALPGLAAQGS